MASTDPAGGADLKSNSNSAILASVARSHSKSYRSDVLASTNLGRDTLKSTARIPAFNGPTRASRTPLSHSRAGGTNDTGNGSRKRAAVVGMDWAQEDLTYRETAPTSCAPAFPATDRSLRERPATSRASWSSRG